MNDKHALHAYFEIPDWLYFTLYDERNGILEFRVDTVTLMVSHEHQNEWHDLKPILPTEPEMWWLELKIQDTYGR